MKEDITQSKENITEVKEEFPIIVEKLLNVDKELNEIDDYFNELPNLQSQVDEELSDILHYIEDNNLTPKQCGKMISLIKEKRIKRRRLLNDYEIKKVYTTHRNKIGLENQRPFLLTEIHKKVKELNQQYRYRRFGANIEDTQERKKVAEKEIKDLLK